LLGARFWETTLRGFNVPSSVPEFVVVYDLRGDGWRLAQRHYRFWSYRFTTIETLDEHHAVLTFYPSRDRRWARWEAYRKDWIYRELNKINGKA